jgi:hydroxyacylglutathione hydrolase
LKHQFQSDNFTVFESALYRTCSAVISVGKCLWVVDPNWLPGEIQFIRDFVDQQKNNKNIFLLCTHSDYDHIIGFGAFPEAEIVAGRDFVTHPQPQKVVQQILDFDDMYYITRNYPVTYPEVNHIINNFGQEANPPSRESGVF